MPDPLLRRPGDPGYPNPMAPPAAVSPFTEVTRSGSRTVQAAHDVAKVKTPEILEAERKAAEAAKARVAAAKAEAEANLQIEQHERATAEERVRLEQEDQERRAEELRQRQESVARQSADAEQRRVEMEKAATPTTYYQDQSAPRRFMTAIILGLAEGANTQGGPSSAMQIYRANEASDRKQKEDRMTATEKAHGAAAGRLGDTQKRIDTLNEEIVKGRKMIAELGAVAKKIPTATVRAQKAMAELDTLIGEKQLEQQNLFAVTHTGEQVSKTSGGSTRTVTGEKAGSDAGPSYPERTGTAAAQGQSAQLAHAKDLITKHPEAYAEVQAAMRAEGKTTAGSKGLFSPLITAGKIVGVVPTSLDQRLTTPEARAIYSALAPVITAKARQLDPVGTLNLDSINKGQEHLGMATRAAADLGTEIDQLKEQSDRVAAAGTAVPKNQPKVTPELAGALDHLRKNPNDTELRTALEARGVSREILDKIGRKKN